MGMELSLQAVPEAWRQRQNELDSDIWHDIFQLSSWEEAAVEDEEEQLSPIVRALLSTDPGIELHGFDLEKRWDLLAYMLSESRRTNGKGFEPNLGWIAIRGERHSTAVSMQGMPILYTPPSTIERVKAFLNSLADEDLRHAYYLATNDDQGIYRFDPAGACEKEREEMVSRFYELRQFYRTLPSDYAVFVRID